MWRRRSPLLRRPWRAGTGGIRCTGGGPRGGRWVARSQGHDVTIERRGRSHRAICVCGWESHAWTELRPAEADAWHHAFGDAIVDVDQTPQVAPAPPADEPSPDARAENVELLVRRARELAGGP